MGFFRRLWLFFKIEKMTREMLHDESFSEATEDGYRYFDTIVYVDEETGETFSITLSCTCGDAVEILYMDDDYDPALPHFACDHCDNVCRLKGCEQCMVYSKMVDARIAMEEPPQQ